MYLRKLCLQTTRFYSTRGVENFYFKNDCNKSTLYVILHHLEEASYPPKTKISSSWLLLIVSQGI
jgi:hypothetical protein